MRQKIWRPICENYQFLKPNQKINSIKINFAKKRPQHHFQVAYFKDQSIRKDVVSAEALDKIIRYAKWSREINAPIAKVQFIEILQPTKIHCEKEKAMIQVYSQNLEITLENLGKLTLVEAIYLLTQSLRACEAIFRRNSQIRLKQSDIGLNHSGLCIFSIDNCLLENTTINCRQIMDQKQIIEQLLKMIKNKSQCGFHVLSQKIQTQFFIEEYTFQKLNCYIQNFITTNNLKIPLNLKYLVTHDRIKENSKRIEQNKLLFREKSPNAPKITEEVSKTHRILPRSNRHEKQNVAKSPINNRTNGNKISFNTILDANNEVYRKTFHNFNTFQSNILTTDSINKTSTNKKSRKASLKFDSIKRFKQQNELKREKILENKSNSNFNNASKDKMLNPRYRSHSSAGIKIINMLNKKQEPKQSLNSVGKRLSVTSENNYTKGHKLSILDKSKFTNCCSDNESKDLQARVSRTINDIFETESKVKKTHKSSIANNTFKILQNLESNEEFQSFQASPENMATKKQLPDVTNFKITSYNFEKGEQFNGLESIKQIQSLIGEGIIKTNQWTKTIKDLFSDYEATRLNMSITEGQEVNNYLSDIKLQKLQLLNKQLAVSLIPQQ